MGKQLFGSRVDNERAFVFAGTSGRRTAVPERAFYQIGGPEGWQSLAARTDCHTP